MSFNAASDSELENDSSHVSESNNDKNDTDDEDYVFALLVNPVDVIWKLVTKDIPVIPQFQLRITRYLAADMIPFYLYNFGKYNIRQWSAGGTLGLRISPLGTGLEGFYLVSRIIFQYWKVVTQDNCHFDHPGLGFLPCAWFGHACIFCEGCKEREYDLIFFDTTLEAGYSWVWDNFIVNLGMAGGWGHNVHEDEDGVVFLFNTSLGFAI